jgi:hypothetical protein
VRRRRAVCYTYSTELKTEIRAEMNPTSLLQLLPGPFNFLRQEEEEVRRLLPDLDKALPQPRPIFLDDESATPIKGFPILLSPGMEALRNALKQYLLAEESVQLAILSREAHDRKQYAASWDHYRALFLRASENATNASYGRQYPAVFWLHHSLEVARLLKETPKRILRQNLEIGRRHGDQIKYRVLERYLDRVLSTTYDLVQKLAGATEEVEEELFPRLLTRMRDNVLIFTEDHLSHDMSELGSYFNGYLKIDGRNLRQRLDELQRWHAEQLETDRELRATAVHLLGVDPRPGTPAARDLLNRMGYLSFLAARKSYNRERLLPPDLVQVWESLLVKLKEFELFHGVRRTLLPVEERDGALVCRESPSGRVAVNGERRLSAATRPLDFMQPWVVDPRVARYGLIYDISEFSQTISVLHRGGNDSQDEAFRMMFRFQRRVNRLARAHRAKLEKYLGDGAFYSSREAANLLVCAIHLQRYYEEALAQGFAFDRGMRIALNYGHYRLIPMGGAGPEEGARYEFFGHGLVELSRLVSGKATREIEEVKNLLINQGYPDQTVQRFFAPIVHGNLDLVDKSEEARQFHAYIDRNDNLINQGLVATGPYVAQLEKELAPDRLYRLDDGGRGYVLLDLDDGGERLRVGVRKLGMAHLKGLEKLAVYEIIDGVKIDLDTLAVLESGLGGGLVGTIEREFSRARAGAGLT